MTTIEPDPQRTPRRRPHEEIILALPKTTVNEFFDFVRERGVAGFAVGFILGGAVGKMADALTSDLVDPFVGLFLGQAQNLDTFAIGAFKIGDFLSTVINFLFLCFCMFLIFRVLRLEQLDKKK